MPSQQQNNMISKPWKKYNLFHKISSGSVCIGFFLSFLFLSSITVNGFPAAARRQFIEISNQIKSTPDLLPSSFVENWPTWVLDQNGDFMKIPDSDGYVNPTSIDKLWLPIDLKQPEIRLSLGLHVKDGVIRHIMPAVDASFHGKHHNRGLCSAPRAHRWLDFKSNTINEWNKFELTLASRKTDEENEDEENEDEENEPWLNLGSKSSSKVKDSLEAAVSFITGNPPEELGSGSHIIHVIIGKFTECPTTGYELRALLGSSDEPDFIGLLQVQTVATQAGSASEFLPEVYQPLFQDESLQRETYKNYMKRKNERWPRIQMNSDV